MESAKSVIAFLLGDFLASVDRQGAYVHITNFFLTNAISIIMWLLNITNWLLFSLAPQVFTKVLPRSVLFSGDTFSGLLERSPDKGPVIPIGQYSVDSADSAKIRLNSLPLGFTAETLA